MRNFDPKIIAFLCNWCSYAGADLAGVSRYQCPPNIRVVRVMCSTRVSPQMVLKVLLDGADGVLIGGCHIGDCHYISGNYYTEKRFDVMLKLLELAWVEPERIRLEWISAAEGEKFAKISTEFIKQIKEMGPNPAKIDDYIRFRLEAAERAARSNRLTALVSKQYNLITRGNVYGERLNEWKLREIVDNVAEEEFERAMILQLTATEKLSVKDIAKKIGIPTSRILAHIVELRRKNMIEMHAIRGVAPVYYAKA
jgi:F420-non-reducing hydrogenase iron-sulfur subunit